MDPTQIHSLATAITANEVKLQAMQDSLNKLHATLDKFGDRINKVEMRMYTIVALISGSLGVAPKFFGG
uniref:Uncharacterized protein n=1 Tax=Candidatus Kentrum sp. LFY TaxID=2126342 RepID=A0A450WC29_9GAMM|nr:MAG: hypothetical protein BECKLFY1418C_GA0070996_100949 [Candidatus Kentron sp. LFY]